MASSVEAYRTRVLLEKERRARIREQRAAERRGELASESISDFIVRANPEWVRPTWLEDYFEWMDRALTDRLRICASIPPRHCKTEGFLHAVSKLLWRHPTARIGYASFNDDIAQEKADRALQIARRDGHEIDPRHQRKKNWRIKAGGGLWAAGVGGTWTGRGFNFLFIDDYIKDRVQAESKTYRERSWDWLLDVAGTRMEKGGSIFVNATRWHKDDMIGRALARQPQIWKEFNHPAIFTDPETGEERSLAPELWSLEDMKFQRSTMTMYGWSALYLGRPIARGGKLFEDVYTFVELPTPKTGEGWRTALGTDLAYAAKTKSDNSALVAMKTLSKPGDPRGTYYVTSAREEKVKLPAWAAVCRLEQSANPGAPLAFRYGGTELVAGESLRDDHGVPIELIPTKGDKWANAQDYAAAWNDGRILVDETKPWAASFVEKHQDFTGEDGGDDDIVDAAITAFKKLHGEPGDISSFDLAELEQNNPFII